MKALVKIQRGWQYTFYKFDDEISAVQFAAISKEHVIDSNDTDTKIIVSVVLDFDADDIED